MKPYFIPLTLSTIRTELLALAEDTNIAWWESSKGSLLKKTPYKSLVERDEFLAKHIIPRLKQGLIWESQAHIFMFRPWQHYALHRDGYRSASINMLLTPSIRSISYFQHSESVKNNYDILPLEYETDRYYLFNNQCPHAITNFESPRYLLSFSLEGSWEDHWDLEELAEKVRAG